MLIMQFHKGNQLRQQDWLGRISAFLVFKLLWCSCQGHSILRQSLWDFFRAAFPRATYYLASATLTDSAVKDIQRKSNYFLKKTTNGSNCRVIGHHEGEFEDSVQAAHKIKHLPPGRPNIDQKYQFEVSSLFRFVNMRSQPMAITKHCCLLSTLCSPTAAFQACRSSSNKNMS